MPFGNKHIVVNGKRFRLYSNYQSPQDSMFLDRVAEFLVNRVDFFVSGKAYDSFDREMPGYVALYKEEIPLPVFTPEKQDGLTIVINLSTLDM